MNDLTQKEIDKREKEKYQKLEPDAVFIEKPVDWERFWDSGEWKTQPFKVIDTKPLSQHTPICSCEYCLDAKKLVFANPSLELREKHKGTILERVLQQDGIWK